MWCYSEFISTPGKLKNMPDHGGNGTFDVSIVMMMFGKSFVLMVFGISIVLMVFGISIALIVFGISVTSLLLV